ncbi:hypothetical protein [Rhodococcus qingshengii]|uniref:hypothetical protein n=1 Tax=Rhodococcus qingshengii TaxID=334542 RepID=UPI0024BB5FD2|nr:hypothetical protein [Rhodococcus qingshengii]MDJ0441399.1 hypothetical protein [Rhodococcus qingshengii]
MVGVDPSAVSVDTARRHAAGGDLDIEYRIGVGERAHVVAVDPSTRRSFYPVPAGRTAIPHFLNAHRRPDCSAAPHDCSAAPHDCCATRRSTGMRGDGPELQSVPGAFKPRRMGRIRFFGSPHRSDVSQP